MIQVELKSSNPSAGPSIIALITLGNLAAKGHSIIPPTVSLPDREKDCARWTDAVFFNLAPTSAKMRSYVRKGESTLLWSPAMGQNKRDMWVKLDDDNDNFDFSHLGFLVDMVCTPSLQTSMFSQFFRRKGLGGKTDQMQVPDIPLNYEKGGMMGIMKWAFVTICLTLDIRRDPRGEEWLLQRTTMNECKDGRFDQEVKLYSENGELVASSTHSCLMIARRSKAEGKGRDLKKGAVL